MRPPEWQELGYELGPGEAELDAYDADHDEHRLELAGNCARKPHAQRAFLAHAPGPARAFARFDRYGDAACCAIGRKDRILYG